MWKTIDVACPLCGIVDMLIDVPSGHPLPDTVECAGCGEPSRRIMSFNIAKKQIEERTHGGELVGGKLVRKATGWNEVREQADLDKKQRRAVAQKKYAEAAAIGEELAAKKKESKKNIGKAAK